jgi:putative multiple sugar transport system substrate-binding protein
MFPRFRHVLLTMVALATTVAGCGGGSDGNDAGRAGPGTVGLAMPTSTLERWVADSDNMVRQFELLGYDVDLAYADDDVPAQQRQIEEMISKGHVAVVVGAVDGTALTSVLSKAAAADIPVITYDRLIRDSKDVNYYATFDNFKVGVLQAQYVVHTLGLAAGRGPFTIELFAGSPDDNNATFFFNGAMSVLSPYLASGALTVPSGETSFAQVAVPKWDNAAAKQRMQRLLAGPDAGVRLDAVLAPNDGFSRGIIEALKAAGRPLPVTTGQDADLDSVKSIAAGQQSQTVYKDTRELAKVAVQMTDSLLKGGTPTVNDTTQYHNGVKVVPTFLLQPVSVDRSNYQRVLVEGGYYTAAEIGG